MDRLIFSAYAHRSLIYPTDKIFERTRALIQQRITQGPLASNFTTTMPRQGDGSSDNAIEAGKNIIHGAGEETVSVVLSSLDTHPFQPSLEQVTDCPFCSRLM